MEFLKRGVPIDEGNIALPVTITKNSWQR